MERFLKDNGFIKMRKREKELYGIFRHPQTGTVVKIYNNGDFSVSKTGESSMEHVEFWGCRIKEYLEDIE